MGSTLLFFVRQKVTEHHDDICVVSVVVFIIEHTFTFPGPETSKKTSRDAKRQRDRQAQASATVGRAVALRFIFSTLPIFVTIIASIFIGA